MRDRATEPSVLHPSHSRLLASRRTEAHPEGR